MSKRKASSKANGSAKKGAAVPDLISEIENRPRGCLKLFGGAEFEGFSFGAPKSMAGEVVFNTAMVGYPESLTDPSYRGQILVLTFPCIGNYGVPTEDLDEWGMLANFESDSIQVSGLIITDYSHEHSHWNAARSLSEWLTSQGVPALYGIDTRAITKLVRESGCVMGQIVQQGDDDVGFSDPNKRNLVAEVSCKEKKVYNDTPDAVATVLAVDCGMKFNIIRQLLSHKVRLIVVPWDYDFMEEKYDALFLSNGPGDPTSCGKTIANIKRAVDANQTIFGICLGNQLLALAIGGRTVKMAYGNRGVNQPCIDARTRKCYITPQNHGYAVDADSLPEGWMQLFVNANDFTNEGIIHQSKPIFSVQFHPEACGGPTDTRFLFKDFINKVVNPQASLNLASMIDPPAVKMKKVLLLGSGGLSIGQAGEFDYSGSQCLKVLQEEGIYSVLVNPNIATVQTSKNAANKVYFLPVTPAFVEEVIKKERPDGIMCAFGGQTALNCACALENMGVFAKYKVKVLGTPIATIECTEDRDLFAKKLDEINERTAPGITAETMEQCIAAVANIGYPVIIRAAYALGGLGSGFATNQAELENLATRAFANSPQVLVEKSMKGWKEVEYEVVRDRYDNCITVCNMENFDPLGVHTGDSIVIAPSQTLSNEEYFKLREASIKVIRHLGVVGECNIQYAVDPNTLDYCIIEVNARLSRSSALASKATGYPLAFVAAKLALGYNLSTLRNSVTKETTACFEPALDYVVIKFPRWDLKKFAHVDQRIGSAMKSVGEVMAIGRSFEECMQKAVHMVDSSVVGFTARPEDLEMETADLEEALAVPTDQRFLSIAAAFRKGYTVDKIHELSKIDKWFLSKLENISKLEAAMESPTVKLASMATPLMRHIKQLGFSDMHIATALKDGDTEMQVRECRKALGVTPVVKQVDTLAGEFPAQTNYLYMTYHGTEHDLDFYDHGVMVLGCGAYRIGSSVEFDWCAVSCVRTLAENRIKTIVVNFNPETVSTDYDESDRLYFEELSLERVLDIYEVEQSAGIVVSVGGQIPQNLALPLKQAGCKTLGTAPEDIDRAEDRDKFSAMLDKEGIDQPAWTAVTTLAAAEEFCDNVGYPCLIRPSYVLSGAAMNVVPSKEDLDRYLTEATKISNDCPVVISKFLENAKEIEFDGVAHSGEVVCFAISEHLENAGVHSGDATLILPAQKLYLETVRRIKRSAFAIAAALNISWPFNIQFLAKANEIKVIECNLRASRSFPFVSKTYDFNFIGLATKVMCGMRYEVPQFRTNDVDYVCIKAPMFSFSRLLGADPVLGVEMASTGEVACFGQDLKEAYLKVILATGFKIPKKGVLIAIGREDHKLDFLESTHLLASLGLKLYASPGTSKFLAEHGIETTSMPHPLSNEKPNCTDLMVNGDVDLVIDIPSSRFSTNQETNGYVMRQAALSNAIPLITNIKNARLTIAALSRYHSKTDAEKFEIEPWDTYSAQNQAQRMSRGKSSLQQPSSPRRGGLNNLRL